jgi:ADP-heptose:LPS heptosyltransferase
MPKKDFNKIVISRTDSIGDVMLTLPLAGILKKEFPKAQIVFLGNTYTKDIISCCEHVDEVWEWAVLTKLSYNEQQKWLIEQNVDAFIHVFPRKEIARLAKKANINYRIGTSHRSFHLISCNKLTSFSRKKSDLHEAQLNVKLLKPLGIKKEYNLNELSNLAGFNKIPALPEKFQKLLDVSKKTVVLHPKSQGSAIEWGVDNFVTLAKELALQECTIFFTGTEKESSFFRDDIPKDQNIIDLSGQMTLSELISFISKVDFLVAASTGPLHIAAASGTHAIGLYSEKRPIHAGRWQPIGKEITILKSKNNSDPTQPLLIDYRDVMKAIVDTL